MRNKAKVIPTPRPAAWAQALLAGAIGFAVLSVALLALL